MRSGGLGSCDGLLNLDTAVYFGLDEVGARTWNLVAEKMEREYDGDPEWLRQELLHRVEELMAKGVLEVV